MKKVLILLVTILIGLALFTVNATALPMIAGEITFGGSFTATGGGGIADATGLTIPSAYVTGSTLDLSAPFLTPATFTSFTFTPPSTPVTPLWSVLDFTFDLESVTVTLQSEFQIALSGTGILHKAGFDPTPGLWFFSGDKAGSSLFTFSSSSSVSVPDADIMLLLGPALLGLGVFSRKYKRS